MKTVLLSFLLASLGCAHDELQPQVHPKEILTLNKMNMLDRHFLDLCGKDCWIESCWYEGERTVCDVHFSFMSKSDQARVIYEAYQRTAKQGLRVEFIPEDSFGTGFAKAFFFVLGAGMASAALGR